MNRAPQVGDNACSTAGCWTTWLTPSTPIVPNQSSITGPNSQPTAPVPNRCAANRPTRITSAIGSISPPGIPGVATFSPSTADVTEIAGVIIPSPKNSPAPSRPSVIRIAARGTFLREISAASAMIPPSPRLWARMITIAYLIETMITSAQKISDTIP